MLFHRKDFVARTLAELTEALQRAVFTHRYARLPGLLQRVDPRVKLVTLMVFLIGAGMAHHIETLLGLYVFSLFLAIVSRVPLGFFLKRVWFFIPIFAGIIAVPAIFNIITPGRPVLTILRFSDPVSLLGLVHIPAEITVTEQGLKGAAIFVVRVADSVSLAVLLVLTTEWMRLLSALSAFRFPRMGILMLAMTYRYIFLFLRVAEEMFLARRSRTVGHTPAREKRRWIAGGTAFLLNRSYNLGNEVYLAMLSRGWNGRARVLEELHAGWLDAAWAVFSLLVLIAIVFSEKGLG